MAIGKINYPVAEINSLLGAIKQAPNIYATQSGVTQQITEATEGLASTTQVEEAIDEAIGNLTGKADIDGTYAQMSVGFAQEIVGDGSATEEEFSFRPTAGEDRNVANTTYYDGERNGVARIEKIKGNTVVLNQHFKGVNTRTIYGYKTSSEGNIVTIENVSASTPSYGNMADIIDFSITAGHKYLALADTPFRITINGLVGWQFELNEITISAPDLDYGEIWVRMPSAPPLDILPVGGSVSFTLVIHDLTKMFGAGNEPTTVEEFYERLPKGVDLNAYNEGEIVDGNYDAIKTTGFNQWDGQWEIGYITSDGIDAVTTTAIRSVNYIKVLPNTRYCSNINNYSYLGGKSLSLRYYNASKKIIGTGAMFANWTTSQNTITTPKDCFFIRFYAGVPPKEYKNDICINLAWNEYGYLNGTYQPYKPFVRDLSWVAQYFPNGMRSAGSVRDEIRFNSTTQKWEAVQNVGSRAYASGDKSNSAVTTDGTTTNYALTTPDVTEIEEMPNMDFDVSDYGTEEMIPQEGKASAPIVADIAYAPNALSTLKQVPDILARLKALEAAVASATSTTNMEE